MVVGEASIHNIMGGMESTGGVRLHNHKRKLKQRFDIIKKLGQGTYGKVQLGINKETGQEVAIKTIKKCKIETEADLIRIRREIQIMSSVQHPNIIHIYEVFENREKMVLVMEYAAGGELYDYLSERKVLTEQEARRIFRQIATAVFYCHKHKICHRDLKLENILLDQTGNAKIADFGLSNVFDEQRLLNTFCGSPLYASPEIVKGTPYHGPEVDCWSLGVLLYTLVYGAMPFDGSNFKRLVRQISQSDYFEPKKPSPASPLIKEMLTVCPARRADIERICTHWWVNEGYEQNCLDIAEELAAQTPVRLDLLLSLVPQSASAEKLLVGDQQPAPDTVQNNMSSETLVPTRCHSVGSLMELDQNNSDRRIRELIDEEPRSGGGEAKRKLETTPSTDETAAAAGVKRKERPRRKERTEDREQRPYKSASRHHSAPIPNAITEEAMEVEPSATVPTSKTADLNKVDAACLELIEESMERSPSKERSRTPPPSPMLENQEIPSDSLLQDENWCRYDTAREGSQDKSSPEKTAQVLEQSKNSSQTLDNAAAAEQMQLNENSKPEASSATDIIGEPNRTEGLDRSASRNDSINVDSTSREFKMLKEKAQSLDSDLGSDARDVPLKTFERRRSKIFETAEKFNQPSSATEGEKPKKIFIPGVNVGGAKRVFERKASLSSITPPPPVKPTASKVIIDVPAEKKNEKAAETAKPQQVTTSSDEQVKRDEAKKRAVDIITGAIGKPPVQRKVNGSPPTSPQGHDPKKLPLKIPVGPNDVRSATVSVSTPVDTKFSFDDNSYTRETMVPKKVEVAPDNSQPEEPKMSSKMEVTLKSATLPRPRKTSKAEISLSGFRSPEPPAFKSEVEVRIDAFQPQKLRTQRSEIAFPVAAAVPQSHRSSSLEPEMRPRTIPPKERIIPIQVEQGHQPQPHSSAPPPSSKPPMPQRSMSQRSGSLSRQSTADSDTDSALGSTIGPEPIRKSPREYIIPIAVEGGGYVTPRSGSVEPESKTSTPTSASAPRSSRFARPRRMSSLLSDASEDESPFSSLHRDSEDLLQRHMHRLRSSRPSRQPPEHADSLSSGEDDDDDGFELLTAENLFSTLLSRVRSLTQRLNVDDGRNASFPSSRLFGRLGANSPQAFWGLNKPLSRRLTESQFKHSLSREGDMFARKDAATNSSNPGTPNSPSSQGTPSRESLFELGSNTLPRDKVGQEDADAEVAPQNRIERQEAYEQNFTPSLAKRLSRHMIDENQSLTRSSSYGNYELDDSVYLPDQPSFRKFTDPAEFECRLRTRSRPRSPGTMSSRRSRSFARTLALSLPEDDYPLSGYDPSNQEATYKSHRRRHSTADEIANHRDAYRTERIQEEGSPGFLTAEETSIASNPSADSSITENPERNSIKSYDTSPTSSSKSDLARNFENRLLAAENLIKESKLKNLGPGAYSRNLTSNYKDSEKCEKEPLDSTESPGSVTTKRRSCIPSLRLRSMSLTREPGLDRGKYGSSSRDSVLSPTGERRTGSPEKSILSKLFRGNSATRSGTQSSETEKKEKLPAAPGQKPKQRRISRFLRPDFFDTPREESLYAKEKEAQKAAENERRKSRFMKRKTESKEAPGDNDKGDKEAKNEINNLKKLDTSPPGCTDISSESTTKDSSDNRLAHPGDVPPGQSGKSNFLHSLEKKLERFRSNEDGASTKTLANGNVPSSLTEIPQVPLEVNARENSAPPTDSSPEPKEPSKLKKTLSVEDVPSKATQSNAKNKVSSMLSLFKNSDSKNRDASVNGSRSTSAFLSKLKKSPPKYTSSSEATDSSSGTSRIPTKFAKSESKITKKVSEPKRPTPEKIVTDRNKKSPPKDKTKISATTTKETNSNDSTNVKDKRPSKELLKRSSLTGEKTTTTETNSSSADANPGKVDSTKVEVGTKVEGTKKELGQDSPGEKTSKTEDKKLAKTKKNVSLVKNGTSGETTASGGVKSENTEKKVKKIVKSKESIDKEENDTMKRKKIVRVVRRVVKKSSESPTDAKSEDKSRSSVKMRSKRTSPPKNEPSTAESGSNNLTNKFKGSKESESDSRTSGSSSVLSSLTNTTTDEKLVHKQEVPQGEALETLPPGKDEKTTTSVQVEKASEPPKQSASRTALRLDLSKIPQHPLRNGTPKKDSPKVEEHGKHPEEFSDGLLDCLSKMTHRANITGNKIIIDKPLRAKDVAELKKEVTECARIIESKIESKEQPCEPIIEKTPSLPEVRPSNPISPLPDRQPPEIIALPEEVSRSSSSHGSERPEPRIPTRIQDTQELLSPMDDPESFDSWSLSSLEYTHPRVAELPSPGSPSPPHSSLMRGGDNSESVIDRIRRRSFYSRFNDRRRPSLTVPPPGITLPSSSSTLPRKFGSKLSSSSSSYGTGMGLSRLRHSERLLEPYDAPGEVLSPNPIPSTHRRSISIGRDRYSGDYAGGTLVSPTYESLRRYPPRSPSLDLSRGRYPLGDFNSETEPGIASPKPGLLGEAHGESRPSTFTRMYSTGSITPEPKSIEYYEELLAPTNPEYLISRKSPLPMSGVNEYPSRCENGYHNGNLEHGVRARKLSSLGIPDRLSVDEFDTDIPGETEHKRGKGDRASEARTLSVDSVETSNVCTPEARN